MTHGEGSGLLKATVQLLQKQQKQQKQQQQLQQQQQPQPRASLALLHRSIPQ